MTDNQIVHICNYKGKRVLLYDIDCEEGTLNIVFNYRIEGEKIILTKSQEAYLIKKIGKIFNRILKEGIKDELK